MDKVPSDFQTPSCQTIKTCKYCGTKIKASQSEGKVTGEENESQNWATYLSSYYRGDVQNFCDHNCARQYLKSEAVRRVKNKELKDSKSATSEKVHVISPDPFIPNFNKNLKDLDFLGDADPNKLS